MQRGSGLLVAFGLVKDGDVALEELADEFVGSAAAGFGGSRIFLEVFLEEFIGVFFKGALLKGL